MALMRRSKFFPRAGIRNRNERDRVVGGGYFGGRAQSSLSPPTQAEGSQVAPVRVKVH